MNKQVLSPFDCDMCAMIEDITKQEIEVTASDTSIRLSWAQNGSDGNGYCYTTESPVNCENPGCKQWQKRHSQFMNDKKQ